MANRSRKITVTMADNKSAWDKIVGFLNPTPNSEVTKKISADYSGSGSGSYRLLFATGFNGEKDMGELGPIKDYKPDYAILTLRSWQAFLESNLAQTIIGRKTKWVIGKGLKLQAEPAKGILKEEGIAFDNQAFCDQVEARFNLYRKSKTADYAGMNSLNKLASEAYKNAIVGGDVLVVLRLIDGIVKVQLIDAAHVMSPQYGNEIWPQVLANGNMIRNGVELDAQKKIVAFYVRNWDNPNTIFKTERIPARIEGLDVECAFLIYGLNFRLDSVRGLPLLSVVLETIKKLDRYKEATVGSAEERQKIAYTIEHTKQSTGENPLAAAMAKALDSSNPRNEDLPKDTMGNNLANTIAATTNKQVFNLPIDSQLKSLASVNELSFKEFFNVNADHVCAAVQIPPNVAFSKYEDSFSASRAALMDWENTLDVDREEFTFYEKVYQFWFMIEVLNNRIQAPGFLKALYEKDNILTEAYLKARFIGAPVPHIDPVKEVKAQRMKLGLTGDSLPLTTLEAATEALNGGESRHNLEQYSKELKSSKDLGIFEEPITLQPANGAAC